MTTGPHLVPGDAAFVVHEVARRPPQGEGRFRWVHLERRDCTTAYLANTLARAAGVKPGAIQYAGRKDRRAEVRQWFSIKGGGDQLDHGLLAEVGATVLEQARDGEPLALGHLNGNRFRLTLGGFSSAERTKLDQALGRLAANGIPNRFGDQRFGRQGATLIIACALGRGDLEQAIEYLIDPTGAWSFGTELPDRPIGGMAIPIARALRLRPQDAPGALRGLVQRDKRFIASAAQSAVFNAVLDQRLSAGRLAIEPGDLTADNANALWQPNDDPMAIPTGPLPGWRVACPSAQRDQDERTWSADCGVDWSWFARKQPLASHGTRRPLTIAFLEPPRQTQGMQPDQVILEFALPPGAYATTVLEACGVAVPSDRRNADA